MIFNPSELSFDTFYLFLEEVGINYFSSTTFDPKSNPIYSVCNNDQWLGVYKELFLPNPPVKKHILKQKDGIIWWDEDLYDLETSRYIKTRNEVCSTRIIGTFLIDHDKTKTAISFGSKYDQNHILRVVKNNRAEIETAFFKLLRMNVSDNF